MRAALRFSLLRREDEGKALQPAPAVKRGDRAECSSPHGVEVQFTS